MKMTMLNETEISMLNEAFENLKNENPKVNELLELLDNLSDEVANLDDDDLSNNKVINKLNSMINNISMFINIESMAKKEGE